MKNQVTEKEAIAYIEELESVCLKHDLWIGGCGCCNSPWVTRLDDRQIPHYNFRVGEAYPIERIQIRFKRIDEGYPHDPEI